MRVACIGGGPAGLYFAALLKERVPSAQVDVFERNRADDTFGWGVVFSDETLDRFREADEVTYQAIRDGFVHWTDIENHYGGECVRSTGHGFVGTPRRELLRILQERCIELGVDVKFETEVSLDEVRGSYDLVVAADGINSAVRSQLAETFKPTVEMRNCRFAWLGTTKPLDAFTFVFHEGEHGLFMVHAYPFVKHDDGSMLGTWIVECHEDTWKRAGFDAMSEEDTIRYCEALFAEYLDGHSLLGNRSIWRQFPNVVCESWHDGNVVLLGDAAHSAHFSIGSGTKLAMEDSIALIDALERHDFEPSAAVLADYQESRYVDTLKIQRAAQTSLEWFENAQRFVGQSPVQFMFNLMTRSKRITYDNLALRDPKLVERARDAFWADERSGGAAEGAPQPPAFKPLAVRDMQLHNRIVVSPMCMYSATDGVPNDWHLVHLGSRAVGGAGLVFTEMTNVEAAGRISHGCAGLWNETQRDAWKRVTDFVHQHSAAKIGIQLAHAGRKGSCSLAWEGDTSLKDASAWQTFGPSAEPFREGWHVPKEMDAADLARVEAAFVNSARLALAAGFDCIELHMAHGYLLSSFLSPASNHRQDEYGGSLENRMRFPLRVAKAVRAVLPDGYPLFARISAVDWVDDSPDLDEGTTIEDSIVTVRALMELGVDVIDVSTAGNTPKSKPIYGRMYQVPFAERIRSETGATVMAVGAIQGIDHANTVLAAGRADLCALARPHLLDPHLTMRAAADMEVPTHPWPKQYLAVRPRMGE
ncbi:NADPH dehydrogenase [Planctomycetes bacterium Pla163]|uniref:NADPH dehydrogenase n=1 Tax=Rohdeia mirabilis TaxID=2528008 RepID=A0A518CWE1_9BACT|nr:NADPH dehydrogenase [Planctomycetes bacterium Pla163]